MAIETGIGSGDWTVEWLSDESGTGSEPEVTLGRPCRLGRMEPEVPKPEVPKLFKNGSRERMSGSTKGAIPVGIDGSTVGIIV